METFLVPGHVQCLNWDPEPRGKNAGQPTVAIKPKVDSQLTIPLVGE